MRYRELVLSFVVGFLVWFFCYPLTHRHEPWDASFSGYLILLFGFSFLGGFFGTDRFVWPLGLFMGQSLYVVLSAFFGERGGGLSPLGLILLFVLMAPNYVGVFVGSSIRSKI